MLPGEKRISLFFRQRIYLQGNSVSLRQRTSQFCRDVTLPRFLAYLSIENPLTCIGPNKTGLTTSLPVSISCRILLLGVWPLRIIQCSNKAWPLLLSQLNKGNSCETVIKKKHVSWLRVSKVWSRFILVGNVLLDKSVAKGQNYWFSQVWIPTCCSSAWRSKKA